MHIQAAVLALVNTVGQTGSAVSEAGKVVIEHAKPVPLAGLDMRLSAGDALSLLPEIEGMFAGGDCRLKDLEISLEDASPESGKGAAGR
jgi:hypothetical protein